MNAGVIINFATAIITVVLGAYVLLGSFPSGNKTTKYLFGFLLLAYGIYRFANTFSKIRQDKLKNRIDKIEEDRDKLLGGR